jgi:pyridinium-3,5-bisthiocarboxylic acid mononucleotide nickel chelatase
VKILYFDCFSGAAGDMILGALIDAGLPFAELRRALGSLALAGWDVSADRVLRAGVSATRFRVHEHGRADVAHLHAAHHHRAAEPHSTSEHPGHPDPVHPHSTLPEIKTAIHGSALSAEGKARAVALFDRLAEAEAAVHDMPVDRVHLHEVGALDSIVDVVGAVFALDWFAADRIVVSPIDVGGGMVRSAHGVFPVPAPATVRLIGDAPIYSSGRAAELLTPTGALVLSAYASAFGPMPAMRVSRVGYGAGSRDFADTPNVLRVLVGESDEEAPARRVVVLECEIDDMNPQLFGPLMDRLYAAGALEVFFAAVQMKKNRPGTLVTIIARPEDRAALVDTVFRETTTIGVRYHDMSRECLDRDLISVTTPFGCVRFKVARRGGSILNAQPEFDDLVRLSADHGVPIKDVQAAAWRSWLNRG